MGGASTRKDEDGEDAWCAPQHRVPTFAPPTHTREELVEVMAEALFKTDATSYGDKASAALSAIEAIGAVKVRE